MEKDPGRVKRERLYVLKVDEIWRTGWREWGCAEVCMVRCNSYFSVEQLLHCYCLCFIVLWGILHSKKCWWRKLRPNLQSYFNIMFTARSYQKQCLLNPSRCAWSYLLVIVAQLVVRLEMEPTTFSCHIAYSCSSESASDQHNALRLCPGHPILSGKILPPQIFLWIIWSSCNDSLNFWRWSFLRQLTLGS
jgi:hypothetical protein